MTSWQLVRIIGGTFILLSLALGIPGSPLFVSQWWLAFTAFVGANLLQSAFTGFCPACNILRRIFPDSPGACGCDERKGSSCGCDAGSPEKPGDSCGCGKH